MQRRTGRLLLVALLVATAVAVPVATLPAVAQATAPAAAETTSDDDTCAFPVTRTDATGTNVTIDVPPERLVALHPSAAQTLWEIGAEDAVVGMPVNEYTSDLDGHERPSDVVGADGFTVEVETVVALEPDLVLAPNVTPPDTVASLRRAGLTVYHVREARTIEDVYAKTGLVGRLTGHCEGADERVEWMRERIERVRAAVADEKKPLVVYPLGGGVVPGEGTFLDEVITTAGGRNLAAEAGISGYGQVSAEVIVARDPQWLILNDGLPRSAIQMDAYERTTAIRANQTVRVNPNYANQPAPRVVYAVETIARALHPEAVAAASDGSTTTAGPTQPTDSATPTATATGTETTAGGQPGFGLVAGLVAIVVAFLALGRPRRP